MKKLLNEQDVLRAIRQKETVIYIDDDTVITPLAKDRIKISGIQVKDISEKDPQSKIIEPKLVFHTLALGSDHTGFTVKNEMIAYLKKKGLNCIDVGCFTDAACDYPDFAKVVAQKVIDKEVCAGILFDATGIPSAITANKIKGIRAATCYNEFSARSARSHNNSNIIVLGARTLGVETIKSILEIWLTTPFEGGRHQARLEKIARLER